MIITNIIPQLVLITNSDDVMSLTILTFLFKRQTPRLNGDWKMCNDKLSIPDVVRQEEIMTSLITSISHGHLLSVFPLTFSHTHSLSVTIRGMRELRKA